jgi:hypothetical protein
MAEPHLEEDCGVANSDLIDWIGGMAVVKLDRKAAGRCLLRLHTATGMTATSMAATKKFTQ